MKSFSADMTYLYYGYWEIQQNSQSDTDILVWTRTLILKLILQDWLEKEKEKTHKTYIWKVRQRLTEESRGKRISNVLVPGVQGGGLLSFGH